MVRRLGTPAGSLQGRAGSLHPRFPSAGRGLGCSAKSAHPVQGTRVQSLVREPDPVCCNSGVWPRVYWIHWSWWEDLSGPSGPRGFAHPAAQRERLPECGEQGGERPRPRVLTFTNTASRLALLPRGGVQPSCSLARLMPVVQCSSSSWLWQHCS